MGDSSAYSVPIPSLERPLPSLDHDAPNAPVTSRYDETEDDYTTIRRQPTKMTKCSNPASLSRRDKFTCALSKWHQTMVAQPSRVALEHSMLVAEKVHETVFVALPQRVHDVRALPARLSNNYHACKKAFLRPEENFPVSNLGQILSLPLHHQDALSGKMLLCPRLANDEGNTQVVDATQRWFSKMDQVQQYRRDHPSRLTLAVRAKRQQLDQKRQQLLAWMQAILLSLENSFHYHTDPIVLEVVDWIDKSSHAQMELSALLSHGWQVSHHRVDLVVQRLRAMLYRISPHMIRRDWNQFQEKWQQKEADFFLSRLQLHLLLAMPDWDQQDAKGSLLVLQEFLQVAAFVDASNLHYKGTAPIPVIAAGPTTATGATFGDTTTTAQYPPTKAGAPRGGNSYKEIRYHSSSCDTLGGNCLPDDFATVDDANMAGNRNISSSSSYSVPVHHYPQQQEQPYAHSQQPKPISPAGSVVMDSNNGGLGTFIVVMAAVLHILWFFVGPSSTTASSSTKTVEAPTIASTKSSDDQQQEQGQEQPESFNTPIPTTPESLSSRAASSPPSMDDVSNSEQQQEHDHHELLELFQSKQDECHQLSQKLALVTEALNQKKLEPPPDSSSDDEGPASTVHQMATAANEKLQQLNADLQELLQGKELQLLNFSTQIQQLSKDLTNRESQLSNLLGLYSKQKIELEELQGQSKEYRHTAQEEHSSTVKALKDQLWASKTLCQELSEKLQDVTEELTQRAQTQGALETKLDEQTSKCASLEGQLQQGVTRAAQLEKDLAQVESQKQALQGEMEKVKGHAANLQGNLDQTKGELDQKQLELNQKQLELDQKQLELVHTIEELSRKKAELDQRNADLQEATRIACDAAAAASSCAISNRAENSESQENVPPPPSSGEKALHQLTDSLDRLKQEQGRLKEQLQDQVEQNALLRKQVEHQKTMHLKQQTRNKSLLEMNQNLSELMQERQERCTELENRVATLSKQVEQFHHQQQNQSPQQPAENKPPILSKLQELRRLTQEKASKAQKLLSTQALQAHDEQATLSKFKGSLLAKEETIHSLQMEIEAVKTECKEQLEGMKRQHQEHWQAQEETFRKSREDMMRKLESKEQQCQDLKLQLQALLTSTANLLKSARASSPESSASEENSQQEVRSPSPTEKALAAALPTTPDTSFDIDMNDVFHSELSFLFGPSPSM